MQVSGSNDKFTTLSEINVTPLVDVMLVLLIIFMVTTPMMKHGIEVDLPQAAPRKIDTGIEERFVITISRAKKVYLNDARISPEDLEMKLRQLYHDRLDKGIFLEADKEVPYGFVVQIMDIIKRSGIENLGMITEPIVRQW